MRGDHASVSGVGLWEGFLGVKDTWTPSVINGRWFEGRGVTGGVELANLV